MAHCAINLIRGGEICQFHSFCSFPLPLTAIMSPRDSETSSSETGSIATGSAGDRDAASAHQVDAGSSSTSTSPSSSSASDIDPTLIDEVDLMGLLEGLALGKAHDVRRARQGAFCLHISHPVPLHLTPFAVVRSSAVLTIHPTTHPTLLTLLNLLALVCSFLVQLTGLGLVHAASSPTQIASLILEARNIVVAAGAGRLDFLLERAMFFI